MFATGGIPALLTRKSMYAPRGATLPFGGESRGQLVRAGVRDRQPDVALVHVETVRDGAETDQATRAMSLAVGLSMVMSYP